MTEEQLEALKDLMESIAYVATGAATNQSRAGDPVRDAMNQARIAFDLPIVEGE